MRKIITANLALLAFLTGLAQANHGMLVPFRDKKLWGFANQQGQVIIKPAFDTVCFFEYPINRKPGQGLAIVTKNGLNGLINTRGRLLVPCRYKWLYRRKNSFGYVEEKQGVFNFEGKKIIPPLYDDITELDNGYFIVSALKERSYYEKGYISPAGKTIIPVGKHNIEFMDGVIRVTDTSFKQTYYDLYGKLIKDINDYRLPNQRTDDNREGISFGDCLGPPDVQIFQANGKYGCITKWPNKFCEWETDTIPPVYDFLWHKLYPVVLLVASQQNKWGVLGLTGKIQIPLLYDSVDAFFTCTEVVMVKRNKKWGIIDTNNKLLVKIELDKIIGTVSRDTCYYQLQSGDRWGYARITPQKTFVVYPKYMKIESPVFPGRIGLLRVWDQTRRLGFIDETGREYFRD